MINKIQIIKQEAHKLGFGDCKIAKVSMLDEEARKLERWLNENRHGEMQYMERYFDVRINPKRLVDNAKSIICLTYNYFPNEKQNSDSFKVSKYAYGKDYHEVLKKKLKVLLESLKNQIGNFEARYFVDSAPILEKVWAQRSGIGWMGKNTNVIHPRKGSFFFLCEIVCDIELENDLPIGDFCGTCRRCLDACPTDALHTPYHIDASKCLSYLTIELKNEIPEIFEKQTQDWIFGCDICQDVCPWNRFSVTHTEKDFSPNDTSWLNFNKEDWGKLDESTFQTIFKRSAVKRTKFKGMKRNIEFASR